MINLFPKYPFGVKNDDFEKAIRAIYDIFVLADL